MCVKKRFIIRLHHSNDDYLVPTCAQFLQCSCRLVEVCKAIISERGELKTALRPRVASVARLMLLVDYNVHN